MKAISIITVLSEVFFVDLAKPVNGCINPFFRIDLRAQRQNFLQICKRKY